MRHPSDRAKNKGLSGDITQEVFEELATPQQRLEARVSLAGQPGNLPRLSPGGVAWYRGTRDSARRQTFRSGGDLSGHTSPDWAEDYPALPSVNVG